MFFLKYKNWKISYYIFFNRKSGALNFRGLPSAWDGPLNVKSVWWWVSVTRVCDEWLGCECMKIVCEESELRDTCHILSWHTLVTDSHQRHPSHTLVTDTRHTLSSHTLVIHSRHRYSLHTLLTHICRIFHRRNSSHTLITDNHRTRSSQLFIAHSRHRHLSHTLVTIIHCTLSS